VYDLGGKIQSYVGSAGRSAGQLRYPYGLSLREDGSLVVCEFGNNRVQVFGPDGRSKLILGEAGREPGQLAFPWGVAADDPRHILYVVDAGNNRVQAWALR
jgi:DNA-binding beta-propeller fold protein YncE